MIRLLGRLTLVGLVVGMLGCISGQEAELSFLTPPEGSAPSVRKDKSEVPKKDAEIVPPRSQESGAKESISSDSFSLSQMQCVLGFVRTQELFRASDYRSPLIMEMQEGRERAFQRIASISAEDEKKALKICPEGSTQVIPATTDRRIISLKSRPDGSLAPTEEEFTVYWTCYGSCKK